MAAVPLDYAEYEATINLILDNPADANTCSRSGCHGTGAGSVTLNNGAVAGSPEMEANFNTVVSLANLNDPANSQIYVRATTPHSGSSAVNAADAAALLAWIEDGELVNDDGGFEGCADPSLFNLAAFQGDIQDILFGDVDFNDRANPQNIGCALSACHGDETRTGGALIISRNRSAAENLQSFACFVNLANPAASDILQCPTDSPGCSKDHPGEEVFEDAADLNYGQILSFINGGATARTPLDFGFFVKRINTSFSDLSVIEDPNLTQTCDNNACHGVGAVGQAAPGGSNFPLIAGSGLELQSAAVNFAAASNFTNFINPEAASLFLYPTNEIANADNPFANGIAHPGGELFSVDSDIAQDILRWAGGLRADNGTAAVLDWLILGEFGAAELDDEPLLNEEGVFPTFDDDGPGAQDNGGRWEVFTGEQGVAEINLDGEFGDVVGSRIVYAVAYLVNLSASPIQNARLTVDSPNEVRIYADDVVVADVAAGQQGNAFVTIPPFTDNGETVRVMLKIFQDPDVSDVLEFSATIEDFNQQPLDANDARLVIKLGRE